MVHLNANNAKKEKIVNKNYPKLTSFLVSLLQIHLTKIFVLIVTQVVSAVLVEKPTEEDSTIIAVGDTSAADHVYVDDV